ncbi:DUF5908 family protein [Chitinophaga horti]|uniref:DUF5908 family protein n=1 Tax=Chitinophaga horti TaxID=2920382 RepID=A0ABY6J4H9_9BACT|nr:DUF5908 family protein [Chitinophaga horti]UYQ93532.1 DUF5908 family protein [Chitinophaga horti]
MPVIIQEIQITAEVGPGSSNTSLPAPAAGPTASAIDREAIIAACVEEVVRIMREKQER